MDALRGPRPTALTSTPVPEDGSEPTGAKEKMVAIDAVRLSRALHDMRSPLTVLVCNRRFLSELLAKAGIESAELVEIMEDDGAALARLQEVVETFNAIARGARG